MSLASHCAFESATDNDLMIAIAGRNAAAFSVLVKRHLNRVTQLASMMLGSRADGEEVTQDTFMRVWANALRWDADNKGEYSFAAWLRRIVVNLVIDRKRKREILIFEDVGETTDNSCDALQRIYGKELECLIYPAILRLPERQKTAFKLCVVEGHSNIEVAAMMSLTVGAVESLLIRARRALRQDLVSAYSELAKS